MLMTMSSSVAPSAEGADRLEHLDLGLVRSVREADDRPDGDIRPGEELGAQDHVGGPGADGGDVVPGGDRAALADLVDGQLRTQEGMVDGLGDPLVGQVVDRQGAHAPILAARTQDV